MKKANFKNLMITLAYLRTNMQGFFKDLRVSFDREENIIRIFTLKQWNANRVISKHRALPNSEKQGTYQSGSYYSPLYEIHIYPNTKKGSKTTHEFSATIPSFSQDSSTGFWDEYEFPTVDHIEDCIFQIIKMNMGNYFEYLAENEIERKYRTPAPNCSSCGVLETIVRPGKWQCDNPECQLNSPPGYPVTG